MNRLIAYSVLIVAIAVPAALLARTLITTEEDELAAIIGGLELRGLDSLLDAAAFETGGLVVSTGSRVQRFTTAEREAARALLEEETGIETDGRVQLRQQQVTLHDEAATAVLNVEVGEGRYVALRVDLSRQAERWVVDRIRIMG